MYECDCRRSTTLNSVVLTNFGPEVCTRPKTSLFTRGSRFLSFDWLEIFWSYELCIKYQKCTPRQITFWWVWLLVTSSPYCCGQCTTSNSQSSFASLLLLRKSASWFPPIPLTVLAVERYHAILKPFETGLRLNKDNIKRAIACIWIASLIICFPEFFLKEWSETYSGCIGPWTVQMNEASKIYVAINLTITLIQTVVMFFCYGCVIKGLYFSTIVYPETDRETTSEKKKLVITITLATTGF